MRIKYSLTNKFLLIAIMIIVSAIRPVFAQSVYQPYSFDFSQKFSADLFSTNTRIHSALKPYLVDDTLLKHTYDSLMNIGNHKGILSNRIFNEHLIDVKNSGNTFYADLLPDMQIGRDVSGHQSVWTTSLGVQIGGKFGSKFSYYGSFYDNESAFPAYINNYANNSGYIPGQEKDGNPGSRIKDYYYSSFVLSYTPVKFINFALGKDKTFIGDGYRSMLLSDFATSYPFLKLTATVGNVKYMAMYAYLNNPNALPASNGDSRNKWGYFQYLDWNVSNRLSLGFFQNEMEADVDPVGQKRGFNVSLASPFVFLVPLDNIDNNPAKSILGATAKYKIFDKAIVYGQFVLNEFRAQDFFSGNGSVTNKSGYQLGFRGADLFKVKGLNYLAEFNTARPYTYQSFDQTSNYSHDDQPLAHPFGANFREWLGILNYSVGRFDFRGQLNYAFYGLDLNGLNYGGNIFLPYTMAVKQLGNYVGQGLRTDFYYAEAKVAYVLNPRYNLRLELSAMYRNETNSQFDNKTTLITIGLRSSFRDLYTDF